MHLAFAIQQLFRGGGLQRDCIRLAQRVRERGHLVTIFASSVKPHSAFDHGVKLLPVQGWTNHSRANAFAIALNAATSSGFDRVIGFNKMPGLDVLYCADPSFAARARRIWHDLLPRHRTYMALEGACFAPQSRTRILALTEDQIAGFMRAWNTPRERFTLLPPSMDADLHRPHLRTDGTRERQRALRKLAPDQVVWLWIGAQPQVKGFDRVLAALAQHGEARLLAVAAARRDQIERQVRRLGLVERVEILGFVEDIPALMAICDLLVHPARLDTTGTVILEALINGLPVITTHVCGYSRFVSEHDAGIVIEEPFAAAHLDRALEAARNRNLRERWSRNAAQLGENPALYSGLDVAADAILAA